MNFSYISLDPVRIITQGAAKLDAGRTFEGIPTVEQAPSGRLFAAWYAGGHGEGFDNYSLLKISDDNGKTWTGTVAAIYPDPHDVRVFDPVLWYSPDGKLYWFWAQGCGGPANSMKVFDGIAGVWYSILENPADAPESFRFTPPRRIANGIMMNKPTVLKDGTWCLPCSIWAGNYRQHESLGIKHGAYMVVSTDQGETFSVRGRIDCSKLCEKNSFDEHIFIEREDGSICCYVRTAGGIAESVSTDGGYIWSDLALSATLKAPSSRFYLKKLRSGRLIAIINDSLTVREKLTAFLSEDDGRSWKYSLLLDPRQGVSYPDAVETADGLLVVYDKDRFKGGFIYMAKFTEEDVMNGSVSAASFLQHEISHSDPVPEEFQPK